VTAIRRARADDVPAILAISNDAAARTVANFAVEPESLADWEDSFEKTQAMYPWLVAVDDDRVIGFAKASPWKGRCAYAYSAQVAVYIEPAHQGRGVGRALYTALFDTLERQGYRSVLAGITQPNEASVRLHESLGMIPAGVFHGVGWKFGAWHDVGYWERRLGSADDAPADIRPVADVLAE